MSSIASLTKQQIAVYKMAQKPTLVATDTYKLIRREVDAEPGAKACSMNIPQSVLVAADKVMKTDFDRAYVHDGKIVVRTKTVQRFTRVTSALSLPKMANMWV